MRNRTRGHARARRARAKETPLAFLRLRSRLSPLFMRAMLTASLPLLRTATPSRPAAARAVATSAKAAASVPAPVADDVKPLVKKDLAAAIYAELGEPRSPAPPPRRAHFSRPSVRGQGWNPPLQGGGDRGCPHQVHGSRHQHAGEREQGGADRVRPRRVPRTVRIPPRTLSLPPCVPACTRPPAPARVATPSCVQRAGEPPTPPPSSRFRAPPPATGLCAPPYFGRMHCASSAVR